MKPHYERDPETFSGYYKEARNPSVAWFIMGWETEPDEDTEWSGQEVRTGRVIASMVGDDCLFRFDKEDLVPLPREDFCSECGQIGCNHDGYDRDS